LIFGIRIRIRIRRIFFKIGKRFDGIRIPNLGIRLTTKLSGKIWPEIYSLNKDQSIELLQLWMQHIEVDIVRVDNIELYIICQRYLLQISNYVTNYLWYKLLFWEKSIQSWIVLKSIKILFANNEKISFSPVNAFLEIAL
jgi:hypothetical protein